MFCVLQNSRNNNNKNSKEIDNLRKRKHQLEVISLEENARTKKVENDIDIEIKREKLKQIQIENEIKKENLEQMKVETAIRKEELKKLQMEYYNNQNNNNHNYNHVSYPNHGNEYLNL